ncbi:DUF262 domain-containing protein [Segatella copri]|jgi:hypothetical protein|uniref:DUF262 domain-containing protein n=1 Tax=Segatella copri TaxID=165179 RepID=A0AA92V0U8_9BACT|nr:DUF262 domain-containing protein [Segatella copri]MBM0157373.1 DUF262 domain-containing protein [Segatella copri]MBW0047098.1 DUF262 domain-containing protein [Segatella copri]QNT67939.1 DUF262 domain-containing protein [Segatella copri]RHA84567.1 DUF262 domain-containing protein [Segatella copri]
MAQIPSSPSTKKISDLIGMIKRGDLILQPDFQRKLVWSIRHKESFIDTILKGFPFPEIYIAQSGIDLETFQAQQVVVDGQQRLSTIISYINGELPCKKILRYSALDNQQKAAFLNYDVVVRDLKDASSDTIKEVFRRINLTQYRLNDIEINNAIYEGEFISTAKDILNHLDNGSFPLFSDNELNRMGDLNYILMIMATLEEGGYFAGNTMTGEYIVKYDDSYENAETMKDKILNLFHVIETFNLDTDSMWYRKSNFFTMFVELSKVSQIPDDIVAKIHSFEDEVLANKGNEENDFGKYYSVMYTGTNSRSARIKRADIFYKYCLAK